VVRLCARVISVGAYCILDILGTLYILASFFCGIASFGRRPRRRRPPLFSLSTFLCTYPDYFDHPVSRAPTNQRANLHVIAPRPPPSVMYLSLLFSFFGGRVGCAFF
jgi:hypothetical protein